jgi:DNA-binding response OmpR family regulator
LRIVALEDNPARVMVLERALHAGGHTLARFRSIPPMIEAIRREPFDLLLLDRDVTGTNADELVDWVRRTLGHGMPIMMLGQSDAEEDVVSCLAAGADAYVPQPTRCDELRARIEALTRRAAVPGFAIGSAPPGALGEAPDPFVCGVFRFSVAERRVWVNGVAVALSPKEYALALLLFRNLGALVTRRAMIEHVWPATGIREQARTIDSHLSRVRTKLALWPFNGIALRPVYRLGSRLDAL